MNRRDAEGAERNEGKVQQYRLRHHVSVHRQLLLRSPFRPFAFFRAFASFRVFAFCLLLSAAPTKAAEVSFSRDLAPVVVKQCAVCLGDRATLGGYRAHTFRALMKPGTSGARPVAAGPPEKSSLYQLLTHRSPERRMPKGGDPL